MAGKKGYLYGNPHDEATPEEHDAELKKKRDRMRGPGEIQREREKAGQTDEPAYTPGQEREAGADVTEGFGIDESLHPALKDVKAGDTVTITARALIDSALPGRGRNIGFSIESVKIGDAAPA